MSGDNGKETFLKENASRHFDDYLEFLRIPSISTDPSHKADVLRAANWVAERMRSSGIPEVEIIPTAGHPVVYGQWHAAPGAPTVLVYGHYDVQPAEPVELWETGPFEPTIRNGNVYARGSADMKANLLTLIQATEAFATVDGAPPVNLTFAFEGEEEIGSPNLPTVIRENREKFACDVALSADGGMSGPDTPSLTVALKGITGCQVDIRTGTTDLHSGSYGATVPNAVQVAVQLAATLHDGDGRVAVDGFYDAVAPMNATDEEELAAIPFNDWEFQDEAGVTAYWGEPGFTPLERRWTRPTLDLNGIWGGFQGDGAKTVTPCEAHFKITSRLVPRQMPAEILTLIEKHIEKYTPDSVTAIVRPMKGSAVPYSLSRSTPALKTARAVLKQIYGKEPLIVRAGGSVPITEVFKSEIAVDTVTIGFGQPGSRAHAPNEWFRVEDYDIGRRTFVAFFDALALDG